MKPILNIVRCATLEILIVPSLFSYHHVVVPAWADASKCHPIKRPPTKRNVEMAPRPVSQGRVDESDEAQLETAMSDVLIKIITLTPRNRICAKTAQLFVPDWLKSGAAIDASSVCNEAQQPAEAPFPCQSPSKLLEKSATAIAQDPNKVLNFDA